MDTCDKCPQYSTCTKVCSKLEKYLNKNGIHRKDWIRPRLTGGKEYREIPFSNILYKEDLKKLDDFIGN